MSDSLGNVEVTQATDEEIAEVVRCFRSAPEKDRGVGRLKNRGVKIVEAEVAASLKRTGKPNWISAYKRAAGEIGKGWKQVARDYALAMRFPEQYRVMALTPRYAVQTRRSLIVRDGNLRDTILDTALYSPAGPELELSQILRRLKKQNPDGPQPSRRQLDYFLARWKRENHSLRTAIVSPKNFLNGHLTAIGDSVGHLSRPNQEVQLDFTRPDIDLIDGTFAVGQIIDPFTGLRELWLCKNPSGDEVAFMLCGWIERRGLIDALRTDRGSEQLNNRISRALADLGIKHIVCHAYAGWEKPQVERGFGVVRRRIAELPGYHGSSVAFRQELRERLSRAERRGLTDDEIFGVSLTSEQFRAELARIERELNETTGSDGMTPIQRAARFPVRRFADLATLFLLFANGQVRIVGKGGVTYESVDFWDNALIPFMRQPIFAVETSDMGRLAIFSPDRRDFICVAENPERVGKDRREMAILARQAQARFIKEGRAALRSARKKITPHVVADAVAETNSGASPNDKLRLVHDRENPERAAASVAGRALGNVAADLTGPSVGARRRRDDDDLRFEKFLRLCGLPNEMLDDDDVLFLKVYEPTEACQVRLENLRRSASV